MSAVELSGSPAPTELAAVLAPRWLNAALAPHAVTRSAAPQSAAITDVEVVETLKTTATKVRFRVTYGHGDNTSPGTLPRSFCVKGMFGADSARHLSSGTSRTEALFYRHVPKGALRMPPCWYAAVDQHNGHGLILMTDLVAEGCRFLTALAPYTPDQASESLEVLAELHARHWNGKDLDRLPWIEPKLRFLAHDYPVSAEKLDQLLAGERGEPLPATLRNGRRLKQAMAVLADSDKDRARCLVHGDAHAGNAYVEADGGVGLVDWQLVQRGSWALDVAYHIAAVLDVDTRRMHERALLRYYLHCLAVRGAEVGSWNGAWDAYRRYMAYGYFLWGITQRVEPAIVNEFVRRLGTAVADHGTFEALGV